MKASLFAIEIIKAFEGCKLRAYKDSAGIWTIGYGSIMYGDGSRVRQGDAITQHQADELLRWQIELKAIGVTALLKPYVLSQQRFDAIVSLVYNIGLGAFGASTLLRKIKKDQEDPSIPAEFWKWNKITIGGKLVPLEGLTKRRVKESVLWFG